MRFGVSGARLPRNMDDFTADTARWARDLGFTGIFTRFGDNDPFTTTTAQCRRVRSILEDHGLRMYQTTGYWQPLVHPDETTRRQAVRVLQEALRVAHDLGARGIDTGPGSGSPTGPWNPHPYNWTRQAREQLVKSLKECAKAAEDNGVYLSLEGHILVVLSSPEATCEILDEVGSPMVKSDFDPVNWITLETVFETGPAVAHMVDVLGKHIVSAHAKDVVIEDRLVVHIDQRPSGQGRLDYRTFLRRMETLNPEFPVIVEGASDDQMPAVKAFLDGVAAELGIKVW